MQSKCRRKSWISWKYEIMTIPAFIIVKNGAETGRTIGVQPKEDILKLI